MAENYKLLFCSLLFGIFYVRSQDVAISKPTVPCPVQSGTSTPQYFDVFQMRCKPCTAKNSKVDSSGFNCICEDNYRTKRYFGGDSVECEQCPPGQVTTADGLSCITCSSVIVSVGPGTASECPTCANPTATITVEKGLDGGYLEQNDLQTSRCVSCANLTLPADGSTRCERCSHILDTSESKDCVCDVLIARMAGGYCFNIKDLPNQNDINTKVMLSDSSNSRTSSYLDTYLEAAYTLCKFWQNTTSCELLTNLCVANFASDGFYSCTLYRREHISRSSLSKSDWPANLPWLYYSTNEQTLGSTSITTAFSLQKDSIDNQIRMVVAVYKLNGEYIGLKSVRNGLLQLCPNTREKLNAAWIFGSAYEQNCKLNVYDLMTKETLFYDPYLEFSSSSGTSLYPIPVLITNYVNQDGQVNDDSDRSKWQLTRRFFLVDNDLFPGNSRPQVVRYVSNMELAMTLVDGKDGRIKTPYLKITYSFEEDEEINANDTVSTQFKVNYELNSEKFDDDINIALSVMGVFAALYAAIQTWTWARRTGEPAFPVVVIKFLAFSTGTLSNGFLIALVGISVWWLVFFKRQDVVYLLPITEEQERFFGNFVIIAVVLKFFDIFHLFAKQVKVDIFLIDWERPKSVSKENQSGNQNSEKSAESPVSIWRTYFVANEWNEIQTIRQICPLFQLIVTLLFLKVIGFENLCTKDRSSKFVIDENEYNAPHSNMFRFGVMAAIWFVAAGLQWVFFTLIWERFLEDKVRQFVDLCSMANISVFIMENAQFGYYIHGRSPHGIADTGMKEMFRQLKRETENLCAHRGLEATADAQTFRMSLQPGIRTKYDAVFANLNSNVQSPTNRGQGGDVSDKQFLDLNANAEINKFLSDFIDHSLDSVDYVVKDKAWYESLLNAEFEMVIDRGFFYNDNGHSFDQVLFYGNELTLTTFEVLLFGLIDMYFHQGYVLSAVLVYFVGLFFRLLRDGLGRSNLAVKTLVDERFLI